MNSITKELIERYPALEECAQTMEQAATRLIDCFQNRGTLLLCGNGGSAADAEHWSGELLKGFCSKRPLLPEQCTSLPQPLASKLQQGVPAIPLNGFLSLSSAFANDVDPTLLYAQLVWALGKPGDVLVALSTSGNAQNVIAACHAARARGMHCIGLTGQTGGRLYAEGLCEECIRVPESETYRVQELHLPVYHAICRIIEATLWPS